jgi:hypothetical protein
MPITILGSDTITQDRRAELGAAVVPAWRHLSKLVEGWVVAAPDRWKFAARITSHPTLDISNPFEWNATAADVTKRLTLVVGIKEWIARNVVRPYRHYENRRQCGRPR